MKSPTSDVRVGMTAANETIVGLLAAMLCTDNLRFLPCAVADKDWS